MESNRQAGRELDVEVGTALGRTGWELSLEFLPHYSTTWEGMRLVVEEMQRRGMTVYTTHSTDGSTFVQIDYNLKTLSDAESLSAPHAVCVAVLAALKALEADTHE